MATVRLRVMTIHTIVLTKTECTVSAMTGTVVTQQLALDCILALHLQSYFSVRSLNTLREINC